MKKDYFEKSQKQLLDLYNVDVYKDILFGRKGRVFLYVDINQKEKIEFHVISNHLTVLGLDDAPSLLFDDLLSYIDFNNKYAEISGIDNYMTYIKTEITSFHREINISFPIKVHNQRRWIHFNGFPIEKNSRIYVFLAHDISDLMNLEENLFEKTHKDSLTGLLNKYTFDYHYGLRYKLDNLHILYIDIDDFKKINDQYGHAIGNHVLQLFSNVLKSYQTEHNLFYRLGGDEFVGLIFEEKHETIRIVDKILSDARRIFVNDNKNYITVSIGVIKATKRENPVLKADDLLYKAKSQGKNQFLYDEE